MRDDIHSGSQALLETRMTSDRDNSGDNRQASLARPSEAVLLSAKPFCNRYLLLDTNVPLHQMDLLELNIPPLCDVVVLQTVMQEVKHRDIGLYNRLHALVNIICENN